MIVIFREKYIEKNLFDDKKKIPTRRKHYVTSFIARICFFFLLEVMTFTVSLLCVETGLCMFLFSTFAKDACIAACWNMQDLFRQHWQELMSTAVDGYIYDRLVVWPP